MLHNEINICFSSDNNYAKHMGVAIVSILKNAKKEDIYNFYVLDGGISEENKLKISQLKNIKSFNIEYLLVNKDDFRDCPMTNYVKYITLPTYYRFKIASLLSGVDKVLYLDCDIIVNADISELYNSNIDDFYIGAVPEVFNHHHKERLEIDGSEYYCNAGVLLINSKKWRSDKIEEKLFAYLQNPVHEIVFQDQDILNDVLKYGIKYIPLVWNLQHDALFEDEAYLYHEEEKNIAVKEPKLIHYTHKYKPWNYKCFNMYKKLYYQYLNETPWKNDYFKIKIQNILYAIYRSIFSIQNVKNFKYITVLGIKIKIKSKIKELYSRIDSLWQENLRLKKQLALIKSNLYSINDDIRQQSEICIDNTIRNLDENINVQKILKSSKIVICAAWSEKVAELLENLKYVFSSLEKIVFVNDNKLYSADAYILWGTQPYKGQLCVIKNAQYSSKPLLIMEDGFIRSFTTSAMVKNYKDIHKGVSFAVDTKCPYYDARYASDLENMLNNKNLVLTDEQKQRARNCINKIIETHLTKYNHQPIYTPHIGREGVKKVLVVDQSYGDMSIAKGLADDYTFENMLECAIKENPDADIIVKTHPDTMAGAGGYYTRLKPHDNIYTQTEPINPISLIKYVDKVYVCTTQFGFEALMCGKEVHVFGMPFYAGWGLTNDRQVCSRRTNTRSLEELFYIAYIMYSYYVNPDKKCRCEIEEAMDYLLNLREEYFSLKKGE